MARLPITLTQVLKLSGVFQNGGEVKALIEDGLVRVNGEIELRKRRQMSWGDRIQIEVDDGNSPDGLYLALPEGPPTSQPTPSTAHDIQTNPKSKKDSVSKPVD